MMSAQLRLSRFGLVSIRGELAIVGRITGLAGTSQWGNITAKAVNAADRTECSGVLAVAVGADPWHKLHGATGCFVSPDLELAPVRIGQSVIPQHCIPGQLWHGQTPDFSPTAATPAQVCGRFTTITNAMAMAARSCRHTFNT
jgi:hypothetical protein